MWHLQEIIRQNRQGPVAEAPRRCSYFFEPMGRVVILHSARLRSTLLLDEEPDVRRFLAERDQIEPLRRTKEVDYLDKLDHLVESYFG